MPLFYFIPFNFEEKERRKILDIPLSDVVLAAIFLVVIGGMFVVFIVLPALALLREAGLGI